MSSVFSAPGPPSEDRASRLRFVPMVALVVVLALIVGGTLWIRHGAEGYYAYSPGTAPLIVADSSCRSSTSTGDLALPDGSPCIKLNVPADKAHTLQGSLFIVDVLVGPASWGEYALHKLGLLSHFDAGTQLIPAPEVLGNTPSGQLACEDTQEAVDATEAAPVAALRRLGYHVTQNNLGAQVDTVSPGTAASEGGLECNDLITSFDGQAIRTDSDLVDAIHRAHPGQTATLVVSRQAKGGKSSVHTIHVTLKGTPALNGRAAQPKQAFLGIATESRVNYGLPINVSIDVGDIGGPSDGLALTLGLLDVLSNGKLTGGHKVAATGTIDVDGNVGDVGGVAQKTIAVKRAGAQLFLVPPQELKAAKSESGSKLKVEAVTTLSQALADLAAFGGDLSGLPKAPAAS